MFMSIFSSFDAFTAESLGQKVGFSDQKQGKVVGGLSAAVADQKVAQTPTIYERVMEKVNNLTTRGSPAARINGGSNRTDERHSRGLPRFAVELDGLHCFETIVRH